MRIYRRTTRLERNGSEQEQQLISTVDSVPNAAWHYSKDKIMVVEIHDHFRIFTTRPTIRTLRAVSFRLRALTKLTGSK